VWKLLTEKHHQGPQLRQYPAPTFFNALPIQHQLAAIGGLPLGVKVGHQGHYPVGFTVKGVDMPAIEVPRRIMRKMGFKREQAQQQGAVEVALQRGTPLKPGTSRHRFTINPGNTV